ncbi:MAG: S-layer homology domain-containing protein [Candidatus Margulisiibacteriota bacterium]
MLKRVGACLLILTGTVLAAPNPDLVIFSPDDRAITYDESAMVRGKASVAGSSALIVQKLPVLPQAGGAFNQEIPLAIGKNLLQIEILDGSGKVLSLATRRVLRLATFADLTKDYWSKEPVERMLTLGLIRGYPDNRFLPNNSITRAELTALIVKLAKNESRRYPPRAFSDVPSSHWAAEPIRSSSELGLMTGFPDGTFRPDNTITRLEGIALIARFDHLSAPLGDGPPYVDLPAGNWASELVQGAKQAGRLSYIKTNYLSPFEQLSRGETARLLAESERGARLVRELLDFDRGY